MIDSLTEQEIKEIDKLPCEESTKNKFKTWKLKVNELGRFPSNKDPDETVMELIKELGTIVLETQRKGN